jgi:hypothetical protein
MRSRTELMFQVVREKRMGTMYQCKDRKDTPHAVSAAE